MDPSLVPAFNESAKATWEKIWGGKAPPATSAWTVVSAYEPNAKHLVGIKPALMANGLAMILCWISAPRDWLSGYRLIFSILALGFLVAASPPLNVFGTSVGLGQRVGFLGPYVWMWQMLIVFYARPIEPSKAVENVALLVR